jgi:hypothetical protein
MWTSFKWAFPSRLLLLVSTNDTDLSTSSMFAMSPGAPTCKVPSLGARLMTLAGLTDHRYFAATTMISTL